MSICLMEPEILARMQANESVVLIDCRFDLAHPDAGREAYRAGHLPGAVYAHLDEDLSGPVGSLTGRHPLPEPDKFAARCGGAWGIGPGVQVVAYDDAGGAYAARLWWLLRWCGHEEVAVLDGGIQAWVNAGYDLEKQSTVPIPRFFEASPTPGMVVDARLLQTALADQSCCLIDVRAFARFKGEMEPIDPVAGHIPGAVNLPFTHLLDERGRFLPREQLRAQLLEILDGVEAPDVITMCGSGVTACHLLLAMTHVGLPGGRLYPGSWSEWIRDPSRPVATT